MTGHSTKNTSGKHDAADEQGITAVVTQAYSTAFDKASGAARGAVTGIDANPVAALLGGLAIGAAAGVLIARGEREKALLAPLGERISDAARAAIEAGRAAGQTALSDAGLDLDSLRDQSAKLFGQAREAAGTVGLAAIDAAREKATKR